MEFFSELGGPTFELIKGGGIYILLAYLIYTERQNKGKELEAEIKRSEADKEMASALKNLVEFLRIERKIT